VNTLGVKQLAMIGLAARSRAAMEVYHRNATFAADALDIEFVALADRKLL
jgi:hypothetical protein